jgi:nucleoside-diphosphate-sugar epimerase
MQVFIAGGTGYIGRPLIQALLHDGHTVSALARSGSQSKLPPGCTAVPGNALDASTYRHRVAPADTFVHLVGVAHPGPGKGDQFRAIDLMSIEAAVDAATHAGIRHFVYVSVAHPAPMMKEYIEVRGVKGEELIRRAGLNATIVRPWYVLGPGHWWPYALIPAYKLMEALPSTREAALRLGLVKHAEMVETLRAAVRQPAQGTRIIDVQQIRQAAARASGNAVHYPSAG